MSSDNEVSQLHSPMRYDTDTFFFQELACDGPPQDTGAKVPGALGTTQLQMGQPDSHEGMQGGTCCPPRRRTPAAMSVPAEKESARNWEERKQQSNWAQGRPTRQ